MFAALIVSNINDTSRWMTEHVSFKSQGHAQPFLNGLTLDDLPEGSVLGLTPIFPPDGQTVDPFSSDGVVSFTSQSEADAIAVAEAVRNNPPDSLKRQQLGSATPIYVINPRNQTVRAVLAEASAS